MLHEKFIRDVCEYEAVEFDESNDMLLKKIDDYEKAIGLSKPTISDEDMKRGDLMKRWKNASKAKIFIRKDREETVCTFAWSMYTNCRLWD